MWSTVKTFVRRTSGLYFTTAAVAITVITGNALSLFNILEWELKDGFFRFRRAESVDNTIVVITIEEKDIKAAGDWPIPDALLAALLQKINQQSPRAVGMDLYRDLPEEPGHAALVETFKAMPTLVGVEKIIGNRVDPPPVLAELGQVGLADLVLDEDRKVRRALLTAVDEQQNNEIKAGLATQVALKYLEADGISLMPIDAEKQKFQLGEATFVPLSPQEAGYSKQALGGYQILMNWRGGTDTFVSVSMGDVLSGQIDRNLMRDRMVFIGSVAPSTNDFLETPYRISQQGSQTIMPGVFVHANIASQLVQSALNGRNGMTGFSGLQQAGWIVMWSLVGASSSWIISARQQRQQKYSFHKSTFCSVVLFSTALVGSAYLAFLQGYLVPVIAPWIAFGLSGAISTNTYRQQQLKANNLELAVANAKLQDHSRTLEIRVAERTSALAKAKHAADTANQAKSDFLANMSHELRTPLNGILGYAQILERSDTLAAQERQGISVIHQCGSHLLALINDILDLAKIEARKLELAPTTLHLPTLLQSVVEMCNIKAEQKGLTFVYEPSDRLPEGVSADEKRLRQVLINLLGNAIKFTEHGSVTLKVNVLDLSDEKATLGFHVIDTGAGIAETDVTKLFRSFEQVGDRQKQAEGTGLGLAISQRIVQLMGAEIAVKSTLNKGSEFFFNVKLARIMGPAETNNDAQTSGQIVGYRGVRRQILVVDERQDNCDVLRHLLEPLDFIVSEANNGQSALSILQTKQPDLVITGLTMPLMDGFELLRQIRASSGLQKIPVIVSSPAVSLSAQQKALNNGADAFLAQPVNIAVLLSHLADQLKLEWEQEDNALEVATSATDKEAPTNLRLPPDEILEALLELAMEGNLRRLRQEIGALVDADQSYRPFATPILQLAKQFEAEEIEQLLKQYLTEELVHVG
ncbi:MAG: CHASE2 domain-containing protein [Cyanobacteria bacterium P01_D01_bin.105]